MVERRRLQKVAISRGDAFRFRYADDAEKTLEALAWPALAREAEKIRSRVRLPSGAKGIQILPVKRGIGPNGAFAQVIMRGRGALAIEFGSRNGPPVAPLRRALRGG